MSCCLCFHRWRSLSVLSSQAVAGELYSAAVPDVPRAVQPDASSGPATVAAGALSPVHLSLLGELLAFPPERQPLDEGQLRDGLQRLTAVIGRADNDSNESAAAAMALTKTAGELTKPCYTHESRCVAGQVVVVLLDLRPSHLHLATALRSVPLDWSP